MRVITTSTTTTTTQEIDGEPEEIIRFGVVPQSTGSPPTSSVISNGKAEIGSNQDHGAPATPVELETDVFQQRVDFCRRVLGRIPIPDGQRRLYKLLDEAGDEGLAPDALCEGMNLNRKELSGVLGALGRRINGTTDVPKWINTAIELFFDFPSKAGTFHYVMRAELREALRLEGVL
jgi:hypothetical protein